MKAAFDHFRWWMIWGGVSIGLSAGCGKVDTLEPVVTVHISRTNTCVYVPLKGAKCWGKNTSYQVYTDNTQHIGDEAGEMGKNLQYMYVDSPIIQIMPGQHSVCVVTIMRVVKCWGNNEFGKLGHGVTGLYTKVPTKDGTTIPSTDLGGEVYQLFHNHVNACAMLMTGMIKCWGDNQYGQLGLGDTNNRGDVSGEMGSTLPNFPVPKGTPEIAGGLEHLCGRLPDSTMKCWGRNQYGQLGLGHTNSVGAAAPAGGTYPTIDLGPGAKVKQIAVGKYHTCALLETAQTKCWGRNSFGQLGLGDTNHRGDDVNEMGANLPVVNLGTNVKVIQIAAGYSHTCALLKSLAVKCWGKNGLGMLGQGNTNSRGTVAAEMGDNLLAVQLGTEKPKGIAAGGNMTCAIYTKNRLKCWGNNNHGRLGLGDTNHRGDAPNEMGSNLPFIDMGL